MDLSFRFTNAEGWVVMLEVIVGVERGCGGARDDGW